MPRVGVGSRSEMAAAALWLLVSLTAGAPDDAGGPASYAMTYEAALGCPGETDLRADLDAHIHDRARARGARVEIILQRRGRDTTGEMTLDDRSGNRHRRSLRGRDCGDVAHALAFLAGLAIDLAAPDDAVPPPSTLPVAPPAAPVTATAPAPSPPLSAVRRFAAAMRVAAELRGGLADTPRPVGLIGLVVEDRSRRFAPAAGIAILGGGGALTGTRGSAELLLLGWRLSLCPLRISRADVELRPCAASEVGWVWARATSLVNAPSARQTWASVEATVSLRWPASGRIFGEIEGGAIFPLVRASYTFAFEPDQPLYVVPAVTPRAAAAVGYRF